MTKKFKKQKYIITKMETYPKISYLQYNLWLNIYYYIIIVDNKSLHPDKHKHYIIHKLNQPFPIHTKIYHPYMH